MMATLAFISDTHPIILKDWKGTIELFPRFSGAIVCTYPNAIVKCSTPQHQWLEEFWRMRSIRLRVCSSSRWRILSRGEITNSRSGIVGEVGVGGGGPGGVVRGHLGIGYRYRVISVRALGKQTSGWSNYQIQRRRTQNVKTSTFQEIEERF